MSTLPAPVNSVYSPPFFGALLRQPPHDPTWFLLNARVGWRAQALGNVEVQALSGALALAPAPGGARAPGELSGSLGGIRLPSNVAQAPDGVLFLLDKENLLLKRFDACTCAFVAVPCYGGEGSGARELRGATAIAICSGNLFVCDTQNHRVVVLSLRGFVVRGFWTPAAQANLSQAWQPVDIAFDGKGRAWIADAANNCVHLFSPTGVWLRAVPFPGAPSLVAVDCANRLIVVLAGETFARIFNQQTGLWTQAGRAEDLVVTFPPATVPSDASGDLDMSTFCCMPAGTAWFGPSGEALPSGTNANLATALYAASGTYISAPLDSRLYQCQWHRVVVNGAAPRGSRVVIGTYVAEAEIPPDLIEALPDSAWATQQTVTGTATDWDCMILSGPGRYLWLRLAFYGNTAVTPTLCSVRVEYPRISLRRYLPSVFGEDPTLSSFLDRFLSIFDTTMRSVESEIDNQARYFDPSSAPATTDVPGGIDFLSWLGGWIGLQLDRSIPEARRRTMIKDDGAVASIRGTRIGLHRKLLIFLGLTPRQQCCNAPVPRGRCSPPPLNCRPAPPCEYDWADPPLILEHYQLRRWLFLGAGRLGDETRLWSEEVVGRARLDHGVALGKMRIDTVPDPLHDPFLVYANRFTVFVPEKYGQDQGQRRALMNLLRTESPAHTQYQVKYVAPRFRIGFQSMIGLDSVVGKYPAGVRLNDAQPVAAQLGKNTVLDAAPRAQGGPTMVTGETRIGNTTRLE
jgi:phage tail-like protein